ncbi:hypothetical protein BGZ65_000296 [Modicella reniformis]|uniref:PI3K/PI4K catalytic domain-containing protein n=1 Tax=Modicella reniformis TaxID=1440133 RepID=A0A9P6J2K1_9FUNG|nr:hypothetical protein BGZ65_000296 [Modicella reniformis]
MFDQATLNIDNLHEKLRDASASHELFAWDPELSLQSNIPFKGMKIELQFASSFGSRYGSDPSVHISPTDATAHTLIHKPVDQFSLKLLYWLLISLRLAEADDSRLGTRQQAPYLAITNLQRIIAHLILDIDNLLLDMSNGCLIPVDFGHSFGSATEILPVPELVPFRLTRQLEAFLNPLSTKGLLEHPMVGVMKAFQDNKDVLLNAMDVFVKEPLLDWRKFTVKQAKERSKQFLWGCSPNSFSASCKS